MCHFSSTSLCFHPLNLRSNLWFNACMCKMDVCFSMKITSMMQCVPNVILLGLWKGQGLFQITCFNIFLWSHGFTHVHMQIIGRIMHMAQKWCFCRWIDQNVLNSIAWKHINVKWSKFVSDTHNINLRLALDNVNPFRDFKSCHSTWFLVLLNYNHPPWLVTKHYFLMLTLIILGKRSCTCNNVDVHL